MPRINAKSHKDVEFEIDDAPLGNGRYKTFMEACFHAVSEASTNGRTVQINVIVWSKAGAKWWGGDSAVESYNEDPEASVFERLEVSVNSVGRVP